MAAGEVVPPPPPGFVLEGDVPPPPPGFTLEGAPRKPTLADTGQAVPGLAEAAGTILSGGGAAVAAGLAGLAQGAKNLVFPGMPAGDRVRQVQEALTYQPRSQTGQQVAGVVAAPFEALAEFGDEKGQPWADRMGPAAGAAVNTGIQSLPALVGKVVGPRAALLAKERRDALRKLESQNVDRDVAIRLLRQENYTLPVAEANPILLNRLLEGVSGQAKSQQLNSVKNQPVTNQIVRRGLGIRDDVPISVEVLEAVRKNAGKEYERVKGSGRVAADDTFRGDLDNITKQFEGLEKDFPEMVNADVRTAVEAARKDSFDAASAVGAIKRQRQLADKEFKGGDPELGKVHKSIADAFEAQLERHLEAIGGEGLEAFRHARQVIAKSYDVQKALKGGNDVDVRVLSAQLKKKGQTKGDWEALYEMGERFPNSGQVLHKNTYVPSIWDAGVGVAAAGATGNLFALGAMASRPALRGVIASRPYQSLMTQPSYGGAGFRTFAEALTSDPALAGYLGMQGREQ